MRIVDTHWIKSTQDLVKAKRFIEKCCVQIGTDAGEISRPNEAVYWLHGYEGLPDIFKESSDVLHGETLEASDLETALIDMLAELKIYAEVNEEKFDGTFPRTVLILTERISNIVVETGAYPILPGHIL